MAKERYIILDVLRGFAILGICMANFPEFSLFNFKSPEAMAAMPSAGADRILRYLLYILVDGKFYTLFSLLFGIGFSIIIANAERRGGYRIFYRRMTALVVIGFIHLMFIWSGDILVLYALLGMLLPLFTKVPDRGLLKASVFFLALPVAVDAVTQTLGIRLSEPAVRAQIHYCDLYGITSSNFGTWLRDADSYGDVFRFLVQGAMVRVQELVDGNRYFKVLGLFVLGLYIGRNRMYADMEKYRTLIRRTAAYGFGFGIPLSVLYAWSSMEGYPLGNVLHTLIYTVSVYPMGLAYMSGICLLYLRWKDSRMWNIFAAPGRMALTNYIGQSVIGVFLFYGIGLGLGAGVSLVQTELIVLAVFLAESLLSRIWLTVFRFGPLEWIWRMFTYRRLLNPFGGQDSCIRK